MLSQYMEQNGEITDEVLANLLSADHLFAKQSDFKDNLLAVGRRRQTPPKKSLTAHSANYLCICSFRWEMCSILKNRPCQMALVFSVHVAGVWLVY